MGHLSIKRLNEYINRFNNDKERRTINRWLQAVENEQGSNYDSDDLFKNRQAARDDAGLAQEALSGESIRGQNLGDSRNDQRTNEIAKFQAPQGEIYGFVARIKIWRKMSSQKWRNCLLIS